MDVCPRCGGKLFEGRRKRWCTARGCLWFTPLFDLTEFMTMLKRREQPDGLSGGEGKPTAFDEDLCQLCPTLHDFLCQAAWEDGSTREPGTVLLFAESGKFKACFNDRDQGLVAFATFKSPTDILGELEGFLAGDALDWRGRQGSQKPRKSY